MLTVADCCEKGAHGKKYPLASACLRWIFCCPTLKTLYFCYTTDRTGSPYLASTANIYILLAEFSVRTVNYGSSFFPSIYGPSAKRGSVIYSTDRKSEANKMFIIWLLPVWGTGNKCRTHDLTVI